MVSIKEKLHNLIEKIENESVLNQIYELLYKKNSSNEGDIWGKLTLEQQNEIMQSLEESANPDNLITNDEVKRIHTKWL